MVILYLFGVNGAFISSPTQSSLLAIRFSMSGLKPPVCNPISKPKFYEKNTLYNPFDSETSVANKRPEFDWSKLYNDFEEERTAIQQSLGVEQSLGVADEQEGSLGLECDEANLCYQYKFQVLLLLHAKQL